MTCFWPVFAVKPKKAWPITKWFEDAAYKGYPRLVTEDIPKALLDCLELMHVVGNDYRTQENASLRPVFLEENTVCYYLIENDISFLGFAIPSSLDNRNEIKTSDRHEVLCSRVSADDSAKNAMIELSAKSPQPWPVSSNGKPFAKNCQLISRKSMVMLI